jgi:BirA family biotin operon repressor/biotin-[acetyl-CoA-carboxylase] ligase
MAAPALHWNAEALRSQLAARRPGLALEIVAETRSTNSDLLDRLRADPFQPCLRVAERQTDGRGRHGRRWRAEPGASLTFSLALPVARADWSGLSLAIGVAIADALDPPSAAHRIGLKWPNDLWLLDTTDHGRKLGGILVETAPSAAGRVAVIGIGLNIAGRHRAGTDYGSGYASVDELDPAADAPAALARIAAPLLDAIERFEQAGFAAFQESFAVRDLLAGRPVRTTQHGVDEGVAEGVTGDGALRVRTADGRLHAVASGEVSVRVGATAGAAPC